MQPFLLVQLHNGGFYFPLSQPGDTDLKMIPGQAIMIIYPDTWRATLLKISVMVASPAVSLCGHDKVDSSIKDQQLHYTGH